MSSRFLHRNKTPFKYHLKKILTDYKLYMMPLWHVLQSIFARHVSQYGLKNRFSNNCSEVIFLSFLTISDCSGMKIWCPKMILDLKKMRFSTFSKIEILGPNHSEMMTLRLQILDFLWASLEEGGGGWIRRFTSVFLRK